MERNLKTKTIKRVSVTLVMLFVITILVPSLINASEKSDLDYITELQALDSKCESIISEVQSEVKQEKIRLGKLGLSNEAFNSQFSKAIEEGEQKLKDNGFSVYNVNKTNKMEIEQQINTSIEALFRTDMEGVEIPENFSIIIADEKVKTENKNVWNLFSSVSAHNYTYETYPWDFRLVWLQSWEDDDLIGYKSKNIYSKYAGFPYNKTLAQIIDNSINAYVGAVTCGFWNIANNLGISLTVVGDNPLSEKYVLEAGGAWTLKYVQVYDVDEEDWVTGCRLEKCNWDTWEDCTYYNSSLGRFVKEDSHEGGTIYCDQYWFPSQYYESAKQGFWYGYIVYKTTGDVKAKYDGTVEIQVSLNY